MREHRWLSRYPVDFQNLITLCNRLKGAGFKIREAEQDRACYIDEFSVNRLDRIESLSPWIIDELTLVEQNGGWKGDFYLLAGRHYDLFRRHERMEAYLSICHLWQIPSPPKVQYHDPEAVFWIGFRDTHGFIRVRLVPSTIITPGEKDGEVDSEAWLAERAAIFSQVVTELGLPIAVEKNHRSVTLFSTDSSALLSVSWPDAFGPCQFEYVVTDRYSLLVPASQFVSKFGIPVSTLRTFLSGFPGHQLEEFRQLQPASTLFYRGFLQAPLTDLPDVVSAVGPSGIGLINLCEFQTGKFIRGGREAEGVIGVIADQSGYKMEVRLNLSPLTQAESGVALERLFGAPMVYSPLPLF